MTGAQERSAAATTMASGSNSAAFVKTGRKSRLNRGKGITSTSRPRASASAAPYSLVAIVNDSNSPWARTMRDASRYSIACPMKPP